MYFVLINNNIYTNEIISSFMSVLIMLAINMCMFHEHKMLALIQIFTSRNTYIETNYDVFPNQNVYCVVVIT